MKDIQAHIRSKVNRKKAERKLFICEGEFRRSLGECCVRKAEHELRFMLIELKGFSTKLENFFVLNHVK